MKFLVNFVDLNKKTSFGSRIREKRSTFLLNCINKIKTTPIKILDVGGTPKFWKSMGYVGSEDCKIILFNPNSDDLEKIDNSKYTHIKSLIGDGRNMECFSNKEFDLVISNSVIEHVGEYHYQKQMADEIKRVGKRFFVQTPNFYFPLEPHFLFPFFQFFPKEMRMRMLTRFNLGWSEKRDINEAKKLIDSINLLKLKEIIQLFPNSVILKEKLCGVTNSFIILGGWKMDSDEIMEMH